MRVNALTLRDQFAAAALGRSGKAQLNAVRKALPDVPLRTVLEEGQVVVTGALTASAFSGGGLTYEDFQARLCLRYQIDPVSGHTEVRDAPCPPRIEERLPADATVHLAD